MLGVNEVVNYHPLPYVWHSDEPNSNTIYNI